MATDDIEVIERDGYTARIVRDDDPMSPREWDNVGTMVCFHPRAVLGDKHEYRGKPDAFICALMRECNDESLCQLMTEFDLWKPFAEDNEYEGDIEDHAGVLAAVGGDALKDYIEVAIMGTIPTGRAMEFVAREYPGVVLPLYIYEHGGITMRTSSFSDPWDSGQVGWIYAHLDKIHEEFGVDCSLEDAAERLTAEVREYDRYLTGDVYGIRITPADDPDEVLESCYGFFGMDFAKGEAEEMLSVEIEHQQRLVANEKYEEIAAPWSADSY